MGITTIKVNPRTRDKLKEQRITKRETYDEIINRLLTKTGGVKE